MKKIRKICKGIFLFMGIIFMTSVYKVEASELSNEIDLTERITELQELSEVEPLAMYDYVTDYADGTIVDTTNILIPRTCKIRVTATMYADIGNNNILSAGSPSLDVRSATGYDDYVRLISYSTKIDNSSSNINAHFVTYTVTCELKQQTSIGGVTSWEKVNKTFSVKIKPFD